MTGGALPICAINGVPGMTYMTTVCTNDGMSLTTIYFNVGSLACHLDSLKPHQACMAGRSQDFDSERKVPIPLYGSDCFVDRHKFRQRRVT